MAVNNSEKAQIEARACLFAYEHGMPLPAGYRVENGEVHYKKTERSQNDVDYMLKLIQVSGAEDQRAAVERIDRWVRAVIICQCILAFILVIVMITQG